MRRVNLFLALLIASLTALIAATAIGFYVFSNQATQNPYGWMSQMWGANSGSNGYGGMGGMMGQTGQAAQAAANPLLPYFGAIFAALIIVTIVAVAGLSYYLVYPQMRLGTAPAPMQLTQSNLAASGSNAYVSVSKTLNTEERQVIDVLQNHNGRYLQKYIKTETGFSRLKTHRIIARLAERGIVNLEKTGNTNQVELADWLSKKPQP